MDVAKTATWPQMFLCACVWLHIRGVSLLFSLSEPSAPGFEWASWKDPHLSASHNTSNTSNSHNQSMRQKAVSNYWAKWKRRFKRHVNRATGGGTCTHGRRQTGRQKKKHTWTNRQTKKKCDRHVTCRETQARRQNSVHRHPLLPV